MSNTLKMSKSRLLEWNKWKCLPDRCDTINFKAAAIMNYFIIQRT